MKRHGVKFGINKYICGTLDLVVFDVIFGSFSVLVSKWPVTRKWLVIERKRLKMEPGTLVTPTWDTFDSVVCKDIYEGIIRALKKFIIEQTG